MNMNTSYFKIHCCTYIAGNIILTAVYKAVFTFKPGRRSLNTIIYACAVEIEVDAVIYSNRRKSIGKPNFYSIAPKQVNSVPLKYGTSYLPHMRL